MTQRLRNPGFEGGWWRETHTGQVFSEIFVPEGWVAFWKEGGTVPHDPSNQDGYGRPEMHVINREPPFLDPLRVRSGERAYKLFTFFRIHDAGLYQRVEGVEPGTRVRALAWAHAWSSTRDNPYASDGVGDRAYFVRASDYEGGDSVRNFTFAVGIDPEGGTDPWSDRVVWGEGAHIYNAYAQIPPVEVTAQAETVTVFVRSTVLWPFKHCDAYFDDARLEVVRPPVHPVEVDLPDEAQVGEPFAIRAQGGTGPHSLELKVPDEALFHHPRRIEGDWAVWRCLTAAPGTYEFRVESPDASPVVGSLEVTGDSPDGELCVPPRTAYARTYVLLPPDAGAPWVRAVLDSGAWEQYRWTLGSSADDAGIGPADRRVIAINPQRWPDSLSDFFETYYPGLDYTPVRAETPAELARILRSW